MPVALAFYQKRLAIHIVMFGAIKFAGSVLPIRPVPLDVIKMRLRFRSAIAA